MTWIVTADLQNGKEPLTQQLQTKRFSGKLMTIWHKKFPKAIIRREERCE